VADWPFQMSASETQLGCVGVRCECVSQRRADTRAEVDFGAERPAGIGDVHPAMTADQRHWRTAGEWFILFFRVRSARALWKAELRLLPLRYRSCQANTRSNIASVECIDGRLL
jgi:hypothetical protein